MAWMQKFFRCLSPSVKVSGRKCGLFLITLPLAKKCRGTGMLSAGAVPHSKSLRFLLLTIIAVALGSLFPGSVLAGMLLAGDLAPRGNPDSELNVADVLILQRAVMGAITLTADEQLAADVAPLDNPDGVINAADVAVLMRAVLGAVTLEPIIDNEPPDPANTGLISVTDPAGGTSTITGVPDSAAGFSTITLVNYATGFTTTVTADATGGFTATVPASAGQVYSLTVTDRAGNTSLSIGIAMGQLLELTITAPADASQIADDAVLVTGTFSGPPGTAVQVNGQLACVLGNTFYAENVQLDAGSNDIVAIASTPDGISLTRSIQVDGTNPAAIEVRADAPCGYATHNVSFQLADNAGTGIQQFIADFDDDGVVDVSATTPGTYQYAYTAPGVYSAHFTITDAANTVHTGYQTIVVGDAQTLDAQLRSTFSAFLDRLRVGAIDGVLNYLAEPMRTKYEPVFRQMQTELPVLVDQLGTLQDGGVGGRLARYTVVREENGVTVGFPLFFIEDGDGVWRIGDM